MSQSKQHVVVDNDAFTITRHQSRGREKPAGVDIHFKSLAGRGSPRESRRLFVTLDELFDLTEELDDLCDHIEDQETLSEAWNGASKSLWDTVLRDP